MFPYFQDFRRITEVANDTCALLFYYYLLLRKLFYYNVFWCPNHYASPYNTVGKLFFLRTKTIMYLVHHISYWTENKNNIQIAYGMLSCLFCFFILLLRRSKFVGVYIAIPRHVDNK